MSGILAYHSDAWAVGPQTLQAGLDGPPEHVYKATSSPWYTKGSQTGLLTIQRMFDFARFLWQHDPTFQQGVKRVIGYFLTDLEFYDPTHKAELKEEDINSYRQVLEGKLNIKYALNQILQNFCIYGNAIVSMLPPIERRLECPNCKIIHPLSVVTSEENSEFRFKYHANKVRFEATCQRCNTRSDWNVFDVPADYRQNICLNIYNPYHFKIECDQFSDRRIYVWNIPSDLKTAVQEGNPLRLLHTPLSVLRAIGEDKPFRFNDNVLLHLREPEIVGFDLGGWGVPQAMFCYGTSRYVFGLRKMNEILAADYLIPMRVLSPSKPQQGEPAFMEGGVTDMANWNLQMKSIVVRHRKDPASIHTVGFPVEYQVLGGEGKSLVPGELLLQGEDMQLNSMGIPPQFYRGDLSLQTAPMAARLFEAHWQQIPSAANTLLKWMVKKITPHLGWREFGVRLTPPKIADNMEHLMLLLQMMSAGEVSAGAILTKLGLERAEEQRRKSDEAIQSAKMEIRTNAELDQTMAGNTALQQSVEETRAMMAGGMPFGGQGMSAGPPPADPVAQVMAKIESFGNPATPRPIDEQFQVAQEAAAIFAFLPETQKRQKLREVDMVNKPLADLIRKQMDEVHKQYKQDMMAQGEAMVQQGGGSPTM